MADIAQQIFHAQGPSGSNRAYLFQLADSLRAIGVTDAHVFELEQRVHLLGALDASSGGSCEHDKKEASV